MGDWLAWFFYAELGREKLALGILCMMTIYGLATNLAWRLLHEGTARRWVAAVARSWPGRWLAQFLRFSYYVGIPLAVLWRSSFAARMGIPTTYVGDWDGDAVLRVLALVGVRNVAHVWSAMLTGVGGLCLLLVLEIWYLRTTPSPVNTFPSVPWWKALREAVFLQVNWALYRLFASTLTAEPRYAAFITIVLVSFSWLLNPQRRHDLFTCRGYAVVQDWMFVLLTVLFAPKIVSLWLLMLMHGAWLWTSNRVWRRFSVHLPKQTDFRSCQSHTL